MLAAAPALVSYDMQDGCVIHVSLTQGECRLLQTGAVAFALGSDLLVYDIGETAVSWSLPCRLLSLLSVRRHGHADRRGQ